MCVRMNNCCFCFNLKTGTQIIAILSLVWSVLAAATYGAASALPPEQQSKQQFYLFTTATAICQVVICSLFIYGAFWRRPGFLWPWLVMTWIACIALVLLAVLGVVMLTLQYTGSVEESENISVMSSLYFVYSLILYYCTTIVNSRREEMVRENQVESAERLMRERNLPKSLRV